MRGFSPRIPVFPALAVALQLLTLPAAQAASLPEADPPVRIDVPSDDGSFPGPALDTGSEERVSDWRDIGLTASYVARRLAHPTAGELMTYSSLFFGALYLQQNKYEFAGEFVERRSVQSNEASGRVRILGGAFLPMAAVSTWMIGRLSGSSRTAEAGLMLTESIAFTFVATEVGQYVLAEERPFQGGQMHYFRPGGHGVSGHTSVAAAVAVPLDRLFLRFKPGDGGWTKAFKLLGKGLVYAAPLAVGWSRMNDNVHFAWNVEMGMGVGLVMGDLVSEAHGLGRRGDGVRPWSVAPITSDTGAPGLSFTWTH